MNHLELTEIFAKVDEAAARESLQPRSANILRLLAEEAYNMIGVLLEHPKVDFCVDRENDILSLHFTVDAVVYKNDKKEFLSLAKNSKNIYTKGILGKVLGAISDLFTAEDEFAANVCCPPVGYGMPYLGYWSMKSYSDSLPISRQKEEWDGLEKSILVNFADDILVGASSGRVEIIIKERL